MEEVSLIGSMATYDSQAEASQDIPQQWRAFRLAHPTLESSSKFYGASPCTGNRKIRYLTGVAYEGSDGVGGGERLTLEAGEYAVVAVSDTALLRDTWTWLWHGFAYHAEDRGPRGGESQHLRPSARRARRNQPNSD